MYAQASKKVIRPSISCQLNWFQWLDGGFTLHSSLKAVDAVLQSGEQAGSEEIADTQAAVTPAFTKAFDALDRFELAVMQCLGYKKDLNMVLA